MAFSLGLKGSSAKSDFRPLLQKIDFFNGVDDRILDEVASSVIQRQYGSGEIIVRQGEMGLGLYIILKGKVKVEDERTGKPVKVAELGEEEFFAEMSVVDNKPRSATVTTIEVTDCLLLTRDSFMTLMRKHPELPIRVARLLADRLRDANEKIAAGPGGAPAAKEAAVGVPPAANPGTPPLPKPPADPAPAATNGEAKEGWKGLPLPGAVRGYKEAAQSTMLDLFRNLYSAKAMTRFSVAVLGCPVEGVSPDIVHQIRIGDVKVLLFPADKPVEMEIAATEPGDFTLHVLTPHEMPEARFGPIAAAPGANYRVAMTSDHVHLIPPEC